MSLLILCSGYWPVRIAEGDEVKTIFVTGYGLYEFSLMPFGLSNATTTFLNLINGVFYDFVDNLL